MNASQVRAKARAAMKRREEEVEQEEIEGGEINLIPYLDIVTNLMLFLLASISSGLVLGQLNTTLPDRGPPQAASADSDPGKGVDEKPLKLVVSVTRGEILLWSITGLEGTLQEPKARIPRTGDTAGDHPIPQYDYQQLSDALAEITQRRWGGKHRPVETYQGMLMADGDTPYGTIIAVMDTMRCKRSESGTDSAGTHNCLFPSDDEQTKSGENPVDYLNGLFDPERVTYNAEDHALFHDILFSSGFE